jgi:integrase
MHLESRNLAPGTINLRLGAVRQLAYEAADCGLLSPDLAAGIRRVKGVKKLGVRLGNWLTAEQASTLWQTPPEGTLKGKRDRALLAVLLACGLRRHEAVSLEMRHIQQREEHWAIIDLHGKAGHTRTVPIPYWVKAVLDQWTDAANITSGRVFRRVNKAGAAWGTGTTEKVVCPGICDGGRHSFTGVARLAPQLCPALPRSWRGAGPDSVPARACLHPDN